MRAAAKSDRAEAGRPRPRELMDETNDSEDLDNRSNDDNCSDQAINRNNAATTVLEFDFDLHGPPERDVGVPPFTADMLEAKVTDLRTIILSQVRAQFGICDPVRTRRLSSSSRGERALEAYTGIYDITGGAEDWTTDGECNSEEGGSEVCLPVKASIEIEYDGGRYPRNPDLAASVVKLEIENLMNAEFIQTDCGDAGEKCKTAFVPERVAASTYTPPQASAGSKEVVSTRGTAGNDDSSLPPYAVGLICAAAVLTLLMLLAGLTRRRRRQRSEIEHEGLALEGAPEKESNGEEEEDDATIGLDLERAGTFEAEEAAAVDETQEATAAARKADLPVLREAVIHEDEDEI